MAEIASFRVDFDTTDAQNQVDALADATTSAMNQMENASQQSLTASGSDMERLAAIFGQSSTIIESAINALIQKEEELAKQTRQTADEGSTLGKAFSAVGTGLAVAGTAIAATVTAIGALVQTTTAAIVETDNYAQALGISTEAMQTFQFAAQRVGGDTDALRESLRTSQDAVAQFVNDGTGPATEALELFGLQLTDSSGKVRSMEQLMPELVTALSNIQDPAERSRLAIQLFGEEDSRVMLALAQNPKILQESGTALERYGLVMGEDLVQQSRQFQTGVTDLMASLQGLAQELVSALLPTLNALLPQFTAWVVSLRESDAVQKELIPTLQAVIGYLGEVGTVLSVLQAAWAALNVAFNAAVMAILEGVGTIAQGLGTLISAAGTAADVLGMDGVADKLRSAGAAVTEVGQAADQMGDIARDQMESWQQSLTETTAELGKTTTATQQTTTATQELGKAATTAGKEVTEASKAMATETAKAQQQAKALREAYIDLGLKSSEALQKFRTEAVEDFNTIRQSGTETPERIADLWAELVPKLLDEHGKLPPAFAAMDREIAESAGRATTEIQQAYEGLGIQTTQARAQAAQEEIEWMRRIVEENKLSIAEQKRLYTEELVPTIEAATGRMAPPFEVFYGIVKSGATDAGEHVKQVFDATGQSVNTTMSSLAKLLDDLGIQTKEQLRTTAAEAESNLLTIVSIYGIRSKEAAQAWATLKNDIMGYHDELPPHLQRIYDHMEGITNRATENMTTSHKNSVQEIVRLYQDGFQRINGIIDATTGVIENGGFQWGNTLEELQAQLTQTRQEYNNWSRAVGVDSAFVQFQMDRLNKIINELQRRIQDLQSQQQNSTQTTDRLTDSLGGAGTAARNTTTALAGLTTAQVALNAAMEGTPLYTGSLGPGQSIRQPPTRTGGGTGSGGSGGGGAGSGGGGGGGDSLTIGLPPGQLPVGVPLPSDLGLPEGGTAYDLYNAPRRPATPGIGMPSMTQHTVINVNEPITVQTRADSSTLTSKAVVDALNEGIRRGTIRPELGSSLR